MGKCSVCGLENKCCIVRTDYATGEPKQYCCLHVPKQTIELFGHPLESKEKCEVFNPDCCFSKKENSR
jgi:hypothetical protein